MKSELFIRLISYIEALQLKIAQEEVFNKQKGLYAPKQLKRHLTFITYKPYKNFSKYHYHIIG